MKIGCKNLKILHSITCQKLQVICEHFYFILVILFHFFQVMLVCFLFQFLVLFSLMIAVALHPKIRTGCVIQTISSLVLYDSKPYKHSFASF